MAAGASGGGREAGRPWLHATIRGSAWARRAAAWSGRQGLPRPSGPFAGLKTEAVTLQGSAGWFVIGYFSNAEPRLGRGRGTEEEKEKGADVSVPGRRGPSDCATVVRRTSSAPFSWT